MRFVESALAQRLRYARQNPIEIPQHITVPESDDLESVRFQTRRPRFILLSFLGMLAAIDFDDQPAPKAAEIDDMVANRMLTAKLRAYQTFRAKLLPQEALGLGLFAAEAPDIDTNLFGGAHNAQLYRRVRELMGERSGAEAGKESGAEVPLRPVTVRARGHRMNCAGSPPPNVYGGGVLNAKREVTPPSVYGGSKKKHSSRKEFRRARSRVMKHRAMIAVIAVALLFAPSQSGATSWCGRGRDSKPDHPCEDDDDAVAAAAAKYEAQWEALSGVQWVQGEQSNRGDYMALKVTVEPRSLIPAIRAALPTEADGFPVEVVPMQTGISLAPGIYLVPGVFDTGPVQRSDNDDSESAASEPLAASTNNDSESDSTEPPTASADDDSASDPFTDAMDDEGTQAWMELPGVETLGTAQCGQRDCDPPKIAVGVQPSMLESVRKLIPASKFGVPIVLVPSR